jgi:hypothetical protein
MPLIPLAIWFGGSTIALAIVVSVEKMYRKHTALRQAEAWIAAEVIEGNLRFVDGVPYKESS